MDQSVSCNTARRWTKARSLPLRQQDLHSSLNPHLSVGQIIEEGLRVHGIGESCIQRRLLIEYVLEDVGLRTGIQDCYPTSLGDQRQRITIARALVLKPQPPPPCWMNQPQLRQSHQPRLKSLLYYAPSSTDTRSPTRSLVMIFV